MKKRILSCGVCALLVSTFLSSGNIAEAAEKKLDEIDSMPRIVTCCDSPRLQEGPPIKYHGNPIIGRECEVEQYRDVVCTNCGAIWASHEFVQKYTHIHGVN